MKLGWLVTELRVEFDPDLYGQAQWTIVPTVIEPGPRAGGEVLRVDNEIGVGLNQPVEESGANTSGARLSFAQVDVPDAAVVKAEEGFRTAVKIQQLTVLLVLVMNIKAHQHDADAKIQHG